MEAIYLTAQRIVSNNHHVDGSSYKEMAKELVRVQEKNERLKSLLTSEMERTTHALNQMKKTSNLNYLDPDRNRLVVASRVKLMTLHEIYDFMKEG